METIKSWTNYIAEGYTYILNETWQMGSDAYSGVGELYTEVVSTTGDVLYDIRTSDWGTTEAPKDKIESVSNTDQVVLLDKENDKVPLGFFTVENYSTKEAPPIVNLQETQVDKLEKQESNV